MESTTSDSIIVPSTADELSALLPDKPLLTKAERLKKAGGRGWNESTNLITPEEAQKRREQGLNYGFALGRGCDDWRLMAFDVEVQGVLPDNAQALIDEHAISTWDSVHSGRNRLIKASEDAFEFLDSLKTGHSYLTESSGDDFEIQTSGHVIASGCVIAHKFCKDSKEDCPGTGRDTYEQVTSNPIAPVLTEEVAREIVEALEIDKTERTPVGENGPSGEAPEYDDRDIATAESHLRTLQTNYGYAFRDLGDRLNGGTGEKDDLRLCDRELIDRSATDFVTVSDLYGVMVVLGQESEQRARELAYAYYSHRCESAQFGKDGRLRKWLQMNDTYRQERLEYAVRKFDRGKFQRWLNRDNTDYDGSEGWTGDYSDTTYESVRFALKLLSGDFPGDYNSLSSDQLQEIALNIYGLDVDRETLSDVISPLQSPHPHSKGITPLVGCISPSDYPTKRKVKEVAGRIDEGHNKDGTYGEALNRLRRDGVAVLACLKEGEDYRYYPHGVPDPKDVEWVKTNGEKRIPDNKL
jgi:hypothetical protein